MKFYNKTRKSKSIPKKLIKNMQFHLLPVYYLAMTSHLGRESIENGGSYQFADHLYSKKAKGNFLIGKGIDWVFLRLKSARAMRSRYLFAKKEIKNYIEKHNKDDEIHILAVPSGYAREMVEVHNELKKNKHKKYPEIYWHFLDLNSELIAEIKNRKNVSKQFKFWIGDALNEKSFSKKHKYDIIISLGFTDFLDEEKTTQFYNVIRNFLIEDGIFINSSMEKFWLSEYLLKNLSELDTIYRSQEKLLKLIKDANFKKTKTYKDKTKLLNMVVAKK